jgi:L-2-hydroxyglutarate oxidase LhgO
LEAQIRRVIGEWAARTGDEAAQIVDSAPAIARRVEQLLAENGLQVTEVPLAGERPAHEFLTFAGDDYRQHLIRKSAKATRL